MSEIRREANIPQCLLNTLSDINENEILSHVENNTLHQWLCAWHEEMKRELYDFSNNREKMEKLEKIEKLYEPKPFGEGLSREDRDKEIEQILKE